MWIDILFVLLGVVAMLFFGVWSSKKMKGLFCAGYVFSNLLVIMAHELFNILLSVEKVFLDDKLVMILQSIGFLIILKMVNNIYKWLIEALWRKGKKIELFDCCHDEWRENAVGIILIMTGINDFILGVLLEKEGYFTQAIFILVIFIGFFISLKSIVNGRMLKDILRDKGYWKKTIRTIWEKWIKLEALVIVIIAIFFVMADYLMLRWIDTALEIQLKDIGRKTVAFCLGVILVIAIKVILKMLNKSMTRLRTCKDDYLEQKKRQYIYVASEVQSVMNRTDLKDNGGSFELAKGWILNNESLPALKSFGEAVREIISYLQSWIPVGVAFILGILTEKVSDDFEYILKPEFWTLVGIVFVVGFVFELAIKQLCYKWEKYPVKILREMNYEQYKSILDISNSVDENQRSDC